MTDMTMEYFITNSNPQPLTVIVEPWAEEVVLSPGSNLLLTVFCDREGMMEVDTNPKFLTVWVWTGCRAKLALNGKDLNLRALLIPSP